MGNELKARRGFFAQAIVTACSVASVLVLADTAHAVIDEDFASTNRVKTTIVAKGSLPKEFSEIEQSAKVARPVPRPSDVAVVEQSAATGDVAARKERKPFKFNKQAKCLATGIYHEARGEPVDGQLAVGQVIMNRVDSKYYPNTICGVVFQNAHWRNRCQFSFACDGISDTPRDKHAWKRSINVAERVITDDVPLDIQLATSTHYHATYVRPGWATRLRRTGQIGKHVFYFSKSR